MLDFLELFFLIYSVFTSCYIFSVVIVDTFKFLEYNGDDRETEIVNYIESSKIVLYNIFVIAPFYLLFYTFILIYGFYGLIPYCNYIYVYDYNASFNFFNELINVIISFVSLEIFFYCYHRYLHYNKYLYKHIHKLHHKYSVSVYGIHSQYCTVIEFILNLISMTLGTMLVQHHIITILLQSGFMIIVNVLGHTTNEFSLFGKVIYSTKKHNDHHLLLNVNYGLLSICDKLFKTYK